MAKEKVTRDSIRKFRGYKFYKELEDHSFKIIRFTGDTKKVDKDKFEMTFINESGLMEFLMYDDVYKEYTPLQPVGVISFNIVNVNTKAGETYKDVLIMGYKMFDLQIGIKEPAFVCRQSVNDFFAELAKVDPADNHMVGICCTRDNCPGNIDYLDLMACSGVQRSDIVNYYKDDNIDSLLSCVPVDRYDKILTTMYEDHAKYVTNEDIILVNMSDVHNGWCKHLKDLLEINNFMQDFNYINDIIGFDFDLDTHLSVRDTGVLQMDDACRLFLSETIKQRVIETRVIEYNYSIDMSKFNNNNYILIRDNKNKVYLVVYLINGQFLEKELEEEVNKLDVTDKLRLSYYDKYSKLEKMLN